MKKEDLDALILSPTSIFKICVDYNLRIKCKSCGIKTCTTMKESLNIVPHVYFPSGKNNVTTIRSKRFENLVYSYKNFSSPIYCHRCINSLNEDLDARFFFGILEKSKFIGF